MLLALDTATRLISMALYDGQRVAAETSWQAGGYHTVELAPQVALLLRRAGIDASRLQGVAVAIGPGSYTGLRVGLGFAKGLALAQALPLVGVPTLEGLMRAQPPHAGPALALLEAGRGRVWAAPYRWQAKRRRWEPAGNGRVLDWPALVAELAAGPGGPGAAALPPDSIYVVGEIDAAGWEQLRALKGAVMLASPAHTLRRAGFLAEAGWERLRAGGDDPQRLAPLYSGAPEGMAPLAAAEAPPTPPAGASDGAEPA